MQNNKNISDAFLFIRNGKSVKQNNELSGIPITRIETIADKSIDINKLGYANIEIDDLGGFENYLLEEGDILMSHINSPKHLGKTAVYENVPDKLIHGMNLLCLRTNKTICDFKYANYFFQSNLFLQNLAKISNKSVNQASFSVGRLKDLKIPLPPLKTQQRIAKILDDAAALRDKTKELLTEYDLLAQALFLEMFGDPVINPKGWVVKKLDKLTNLITDGKHGNCSDEENSGYFFISAKDVRNNKINYTNTRQIPKIEFEEVDRRTNLQAGDLVMINTGATIGRMAIVQDIPETRMTTFQKSVAVIKTKKEILMSLFLQYVFELRLESFVNKGSGSAIKNLLLSEMRRFKIIVPPIELQNQFADKIALIEQQKALAKQELQESENLFNCLLQKAFKGELVLEPA